MPIFRLPAIRSRLRHAQARPLAPRGWGHECDAPDEALVADAYGQWADRLYASIACLIVPVAIADLVVWLTGGSLMSLVGPTALLTLCVAYLNQRWRFRRTILAGRPPARHGSRGDRWQRADSA